MSVGNCPKSPRWPREAIERRLALQKRKARHDKHIEHGSAARLLLPMFWIRTLLRLSRMEGAGRRNFMRPIVRQNALRLAELPHAFDGFRILHLSDLHFDLDPELSEVVLPLCRGLAYDICVVSGDFRDSLLAAGDRGIALCAQFCASLGRPVYACLGNHDLAADVERLEEAGVRVLVNESEAVELGGERLYMVGVDDCGYFRTDDFAAAFAAVPDGACSVLLCHDPSGWSKALERGASLMLSGHTHGGQICLPGGMAPLTHSPCPRALVAGPWKMGAMQGYTSRGVGCSKVPARFNCPAEIVLHTLHCAAL